MESNHSSLSSSDASDINDQRHEPEGVDYLSFLPMEVVLHIFSFLPFKYWILMCLVSKQWKDFWKQIPNLELNGPMMVKMVKNILKNILKNNIFEPELFVAFKSLQKLSLIDVNIYSLTIGDLHFKCPFLEALNLKRCLLPNNFMICKEELQIKVLFLIKCFTYTSKALTIDIIAPRLSTLTITGQHLTSSSIRKARSLINVEVGIKAGFPNPALRNFMAALLIDLNQCHSLKLNTWCIQVLPTRDSLPWPLPLEFQNLRHLRLKIYVVKQELPGLSYLFSSCPNMETLTLDIKVPELAEFIQFGLIQNAFLNVGEESYWETRSFTFHCLQSSLKKVNVNGFAGSTIEFHIVKFLLQNAMVLEELNIAQLRLITSASSEQMLAFMRLMQEKLSQIPSSGKASPHARIMISY